MKLRRVCFAAFLLTLVLAPAAHAEVVLVLHLDGIQGESQLPGYKDEILIGEVSFTIEQVSTLKEASKTGASAGKAAFAPITISKGADKSSPLFFLHSVLGRAITNAKISFVIPAAAPDTPAKEFFSITLGGVFISKFGVAASIGDENTREDIVLNYSMILLNYTPPVGQPIKFGFDLVRNKEITSIPGFE